MYERGEGSRRSVAENGLKVRGAATGNVCDNCGNVVIGAGAACAETLQPTVNGCDDGTGGSLYENLEKAAGVEALRL